MPTNKVDHLKLKNFIGMIKCFSITFLETTVETTRCESTNIGLVDTDLIEKEIFVTTKKEIEAYHRWTPTDRFKDTQIWGGDWEYCSSLQI